MQVRPMEASDVERVAELCGQLGYPSTPAQVAARFERLRRRDEALLVAVLGSGMSTCLSPSAPSAPGDGEEVVGWVHVGELLTLESDPAAEVFGLVVDAAHRGRGVGRLLMEAAEAWAARQGYAEMRLRSNVVRKDAHEFYGRLGYEVSKTQANFRKRV